MAYTLDFGDLVREAVAAKDFGKPTAVKRGRRLEWPYVPVIDHGTHTEQLRGRAYATRQEAVNYARTTILARQDDMRRKLSEPRYRAFREQLGLPSNI